MKAFVYRKKDSKKVKIILKEYAFREYLYQSFLIQDQHLLNKNHQRHQILMGRLRHINLLWYM